jgi:hypothetical protein
MRLYLKNKLKQKGLGMAQVIECLPSKSNPELKTQCCKNKGNYTPLESFSGRYSLPRIVNFPLGN